MDATAKRAKSQACLRDPMRPTRPWLFDDEAEGQSTPVNLALTSMNLKQSRGANLSRGLQAKGKTFFDEIIDSLLSKELIHRG